MRTPYAELDVIDDPEQRRRARIAISSRCGFSAIQRVLLALNLLVAFALTFMLLAPARGAILTTFTWQGWACVSAPVFVVVAMFTATRFINRSTVRWEIRRELWRIGKPVCMHCGYRLDPIPERCPECGHFATHDD